MNKPEEDQDEIVAPKIPCRRYDGIDNNEERRHNMHNNEETSNDHEVEGDVQVGGATMKAVTPSRNLTAREARLLRPLEDSLAEDDDEEDEVDIDDIPGAFNVPGSRTTIDGGAIR